MSDLPPLEQPQAYVVVGPDDQRGPYTLELLIGEVLAGRLQDQTPVWWPGLPEWTTMGAHPALAAEINRRRSAYADPAAYAPPPAAPAPAPGQYEQAQGYGQAGAAAPAQAAPGQDFSTDAWAAPSPQPVQPAVDGGVGAPAEHPVTAVPEVVTPAEVVPAEGQGTWLPVGDSVPVEVAGGPEPDVAGASPFAPAEPATVEPAPAPASFAPDAVVAGAAAPDPLVAAPVADADAADPSPAPAAVDRTAYDALVARSRRHADALGRVAAADAAVLDAVAGAVSAAGFSETDRSGGQGTHELRFADGPDRALAVSLGCVTGTPEEVAGAHVPLEVRATDSSYGGGIDVAAGEHGEVVVVADEWNGQATATVALHLPLGDYLGDDLTVDAAALGADAAAVVSVVLDRLR